MRSYGAMMVSGLGFTSSRTRRALLLQADLQELRACGIMLGPAPVIIVGPTLENTVAYSLDYALRFAIKIAPAITVGLRTENRHTQIVHSCVVVPRPRSVGEQDC